MKQSSRLLTETTSSFASEQRTDASLSSEYGGGQKKRYPVGDRLWRGGNRGVVGTELWAVVALADNAGRP